MLSQRGDTIIEVMLAFAVFSFVSVGAMTVMGQGTNSAQRSLEITLVRQQIDAQAEALRAAHQAHTATTNPNDTEWRRFAIRSVTDNTTTPYSETTRCPSQLNQLSSSFILDPRNAQFVSGDSWFQNIDSRSSKPYAQVESGAQVNSYGIWIERQFVEGDTAPDLFNFTVRACWYGAGMDIPMQLETVVRLYEPGS